MIEADSGHLVPAEQLSRQYPAMPRDHFESGVDQHRAIESEGFDAARDLSDLPRCMKAGVLRIELQLVDAAVDDRHTASSLVAYLLTVCGARLTAGVCMLIEQPSCDAFGWSLRHFSLLLLSIHQCDSSIHARRWHIVGVPDLRLLDSGGGRQKLTGNTEQKPQALTFLVVKVRNGYIGSGTKIVRLTEVAAILGTQREVGSGHPAADISFAEIKSVVRNYGSSNAVNASISRACRRLQTRGLVRVVHGPAITQAERYRLKKSKRGRLVAYRSWQAGIRLTADGVEAANHLMRAGTQLQILL